MYRILIGSLAVLFLMAAGHPALAQETGSAFYDEGVFAYEDGEYKVAEAAFKKFLKSDPKNPSANHYLGKTYIQMERFGEAKPFLEKAWKGDPELFDLSYDRAFLYYKLADYGKAAGFFKRVIKEDSSHILASFYCGISLYRDRKYKEANPYLLNAADKSHDLKVKAFYYSGLCYFYMGKNVQALEKLIYAKDFTDSQDVRDNAGRWIEKIQGDKKERKPYYFQAKIAYMHDDNVPLGPDEMDERYSGEADSLVAGYASGEYNFVNQDRFFLGAGLSRFQTWYFDQDQNNFSQTSGKLYGRYLADPVTFGLQFKPRVYQLDEEDYLLIYGVSPEISYAVNKQLSVWLSYTYTANDYRQEIDDERDGSTHEAFLDLVYSLRDGGYVLGGIGYEDNTASEVLNDYSRLSLRADGLFELPLDMHFNVAGKYWKKEYKEDDSLDSTRYSIALSLGHSLYFDWLEIAAEYGYTNNDSNYDDDDFTRQLIGIVLTATF